MHLAGRIACPYENLVLVGAIPRGRPRSEDQFGLISTTVLTLRLPWARNPLTDSCLRFAISFGRSVDRSTGPRFSNPPVLKSPHRNFAHLPPPRILERQLCPPDSGCLRAISLKGSQLSKKSMGTFTASNPVWLRNSRICTVVNCLPRAC